MSWTEGHLDTFAFCIVNSSYGSRDRHAKVVRDYLQRAFEAGRKAERQAQEARKRKR